MEGRACIVISDVFLIELPYSDSPADIPKVNYTDFQCEFAILLPLRNFYDSLVVLRVEYFGEIFFYRTISLTVFEREKEREQERDKLHPICHTSPRIY